MNAQEPTIQIQQHNANTQEELRSAVELLRRLIPEDDFQAFDLHTSPTTVYTTLLTLWLITLQRLDGGSSLAAAIQDLTARHSNLLPNNKRVREGTLSSNTGAFSRARKRLPVEIVQLFAERVSESLIASSPPWFAGKRAFLIDGTTVALEPTSELRRLYPPSKNQFGETVWPLLMLMVAHELQSGCALIPEVGAKYGNDNTSEAKQAAAIAQRIPPGSLVLADANFGIFSVAFAMHGTQHDILFRLQKSRFKSLRKTATPITTVDAAGTIRNVSGQAYRVLWCPSARDRQSNPDLPADAQLEVMLHEATLPNGEIMYLVTTLDITTEQAGECYHRRYDVEFDIRDLKVTLGLESMRAKTSDMLQKELLCGLVAYNLVQCLRREGAKKASVPPRRLSFTGVWTTMRVCLLQRDPSDLAEWQARYERAVHLASQAKLPHRPDRKHPRQAHPRRSKSTNEQRHKKPTTPKPIPPDIPK